MDRTNQKFLLCTALARNKNNNQRYTVNNRNESIVGQNQKSFCLN